jgi:hypothetical protein
MSASSAIYRSSASRCARLPSDEENFQSLPSPCALWRVLSASHAGKYRALPAGKSGHTHSVARRVVSQPDRRSGARAHRRVARCCPCAHRRAVRTHHARALTAATWWQYSPSRGVHVAAAGACPRPIGCNTHAHATVSLKRVSSGRADRPRATVPGREVMWCTRPRHYWLC